MDRDKAREELDQLAAEGRAKAEAKQAAETRASEQSQQERLRGQSRAARLSTFSTWRSISWWFDFALWFGVLSVLSLPLAAVIESLPYSMLGLGVSALCLSLAWWSRRRARAFILCHPFPLLGYGEALHHPGGHSNPYGGESPQKASIKIVFVDRISEGKTVSDALHAKAGRYFSRASYGGRNLAVALVGPAESAIDGHARWLHRTMRRISPVLRAVHATMPIESVTVTGD